MQIKDTGIMLQIGQICDHYSVNIAGRYIRPLLLQLPLEGETWHNIDQFLENAAYSHYQGVSLEDLYRQIIAFSRFIEATRRQLLPVLRSRANSMGGTSDKVFRDLAVNAFPSNLNILADKVNTLFRKLQKLDTEMSQPDPPVSRNFPELAGLDVLLSGKTT